LEGAEKRGPFYIAPLLPVSLSELHDLIKQLRTAADLDARDEIIYLMRRLIPSFEPEEMALVHAAATAGSNDNGNAPIHVYSNGSPPLHGLDSVVAQTLAGEMKTA
jgi:hypothetical protein